MAKMTIGGALVDARSGQTIEVRNPATGEIVDTIPRGSASDVDAAVQAAHAAFSAWASLAPSKRAQLMHAAAVAVRGAVPELARLLTMEQGKPLAHATL